MDGIRGIIFPLVIFGLITVLGGCFGTSPPVRFYTLTPRVDADISATEKADVVVRVGPVTLPSYLERRQIVTRSGRNEIVLAEFDRWGGSLDDEIIRLLVLDLSKGLGTRRISVVPWRSVTMVESLDLYRIPVIVDRFDGTPGETVVLNASWGIIMKKDRQENVLVTSKSTISENVAGKDYASLVAAMAKAVNRLGKEIVESIATLREVR